MTQQDLAELTGLRKSQISDYIALRKIMTLKNAMKISYTLKCHVEELYEWERSDGK